IKPRTTAHSHLTRREPPFLKPLFPLQCARGEWLHDYRNLTNRNSPNHGQDLLGTDRPYSIPFGSSSVRGPGSYRAGVRRQLIISRSAYRLFRFRFSCRNVGRAQAPIALSLAWHSGWNNRHAHLFGLVCNGSRFDSRGGRCLWSSSVRAFKWAEDRRMRRWGM